MAAEERIIAETDTEVHTPFEQILRKTQPPLSDIRHSLRACWDHSALHRPPSQEQRGTIPAPTAIRVRGGRLLYERLRELAACKSITTFGPACRGSAVHEADGYRGDYPVVGLPQRLQH